MRRCTCLFLLLLGPTLLPAAPTQLKHPSCLSCHEPSKVAVEQVAKTEASRSARPFSFALCLSCHDGQLAAEPNPTLHLAHARIDAREGLKCTTCHDPHDRSDSFCLLKGKRGPQTEKTAVLDFCRECHTDH